MQQQGLAVPAAAMRRLDEQVFQVQAGTGAESGVVMEEHGEAHCPALQPAQHFRRSPAEIGRSGAIRAEALEGIAERIVWNAPGHGPPRPRW